MPAQQQPQIPNKERMSTMATKEVGSPTSPAQSLHKEHAQNAHKHSHPPDHPAYAEHGPLVDPLTHPDLVQAEPELWWSRVRNRCRIYFCEFLGTFILIMFGDGVVAQVVLSNGEKGEYQSISWGWG